MKRMHALAFHLIGLAAFAANAPITSRLPDGTEIKRYEIQVDPKYFVSYPGTDAGIKRSFPSGFPLSVGSGLAFTGKESDGALSFLGLTDRGPNGDAPDFQIDGTHTTPSKVFPAPGFTPSLVKIEVRKDVASVVAILPIQGKAGFVSGLPIPADRVGATGETALSEGLRPLVPGTDVHGMDPEGIALDPMQPGLLWLCDEYGPSLFKVDAATGSILQTFAPGSGLPICLRFRQPNRGFEGVAASGGKVFAIVQSILDFEQPMGNAKAYSSSKARFLRMVELDPRTGVSRMFAYPHDVDQYGKSKDAKIGDLVAIGPNRFLILEQGADKGGSLRNLIYLLDTTGATDLTGLARDGQEPEALAKDADVLAAGVVYVKKTLVFDLRAPGSGWVFEKAEGLAVLPDGQTIAVANDNDFGLKPKLIGQGLPTDDPTKYLLGPDGVLSQKGVRIDATYQIGKADPAERPSRLWLIKLPKPLNQY